jgi:hypothetical protein
MKAFLIMILALLLGACARHPNEYTVSISPHFTADETQAIIAGLDYWRANVPVTFHVLISECQPHAGSDRFCFVPMHTGEHDTHPGITRIDIYDASATIMIDVDRAKYMQFMSRHEAGHAMGLGHSSPGTVMCWSRQCASMTVTPEDAWQWNNLR